MTFYEDPDRLTYPQADRLAGEYVEEKVGQRERTTSRDVLRWAEVPDTMHNKTRIHDALSRLCVATGEHWSGRTVFDLPRSDDINHDG